MSEAAVIATNDVPDWRGLVGHDDMAPWRELARRNNLPGVLLIHGRAGVGKRALAAALVASLRCRADGPLPCGTCDACRELRGGHDQDVLWLSGREQKLVVAAADALQEHLSVSPAPGNPRRVVVVNDCDQLAREAANRLLKTLEEPPPRALIIMTTSRVDRLLPTVLSRCVKWRVKPPPLAATMQLVKARLAALGEARDDAAVRALIERAGLSPGVALAMIDGAEAASVDADFLELLAGADGTTVLVTAERLAKQSGRTMSDLLVGMEMALNAAYRRPMPTSSPESIRRRRERLAEMKRLVFTGMVPVNAQMAMESIGLAAAPQRPRI
jgi:DNA polymerase III delta prime subunit